MVRLLQIIVMWYDLIKVVVLSGHYPLIVGSSRSVNFRSVLLLCGNAPLPWNAWAKCEVVVGVAVKEQQLDRSNHWIISSVCVIQAIACLI